MSGTVSALSGGAAAGQGGIGSDYVSGGGLSSALLSAPATSAASSGVSSGLRTIGGMQAISGFAGGLGALMAGQSAASSDKIQAGEWQTQATDESVMGMNTVGGLKSQYLSAVGGLNSRLAGGGVDVGQGVGADARAQTGLNAVTAEQSTMLASQIRSYRDQINAIQANAAAAQSSAGGWLGLAGGLLSGGLGLFTAGIL